MILPGALRIILSYLAVQGLLAELPSVVGTSEDNSSVKDLQLEVIHQHAVLQLGYGEACSSVWVPPRTRFEDDKVSSLIMCIERRPQWLVCESTWPPDALVSVKRARMSCALVRHISGRRFCSGCDITFSSTAMNAYGNPTLLLILTCLTVVLSSAKGTMY